MAKQRVIYGNYPNMQLAQKQYQDIGYYFRHRKIESGEFSMCMKTKELYKKTAEDILKECAQGDSAPIDIQAILEHYKISAIPIDFSEMSEHEGNQILGAMVCIGENVAIFYGEDETMSPHRIRFTVAHELAHVCLTGEENHIEFRHAEEGDDELERAANIFAGELLIPKKKLKSVMKELLIPSVSTLAEIFNVSRPVMSERLSYLGMSGLVIN